MDSKEEEVEKEVKGKVKMQLKLKMDEESAEVKRERAMYAEYEKEEWKLLRQHPISSSESVAFLGSMISRTIETFQEHHAAKKLSAKEYLTTLTAGTNETINLPLTLPEARPFLTELQKGAATNLRAVMGELFQKQQIIPFTFLREFFTDVSSEQLLDAIKGVAQHLGRGIFALQSDRLYGGEKNPIELRKTRNALLEIFRKSPLQVIPRDVLGKLMPEPSRDVLNKALADVADKDEEGWRLRFAEEGLADFDQVMAGQANEPIIEIVEPEPPIERIKKTEPDMTEKMVIHEKSNVTVPDKMAETIMEELRREGVMTYMQLVNIAKQEVPPSMYQTVEEALTKIVDENCTVIGKAIILTKASDSSIQTVILFESCGYHIK